YNSIRNKTVKQGLVSPELWHVKTSHLGKLFHICIKDMKTMNAKACEKKANYQRFAQLHWCKRWLYLLRQICVGCCCDGLWNCLRCKPCHENESNDEYIVYRSNPFNFSGKMLVSGRDISDHMPHIYQSILKHLNF
ncbi:hypothetical protein RFI_28684, partial [Reticulomyxa filosa]